MRRCVPKTSNLHAKRLFLIKWHTFRGLTLTFSLNCFLAPSRLEFGTISTHAISVSAIAPSVSTGLDHYDIFVKAEPEKKCTTESRKRTCDVRELSPATRYTFQAKSCLAPHGSGACGSGTDGTTWTKPTGKLKLLTYAMEPLNLMCVLFQLQVLQRLTAAQQAKLLSHLQQWLRKITSWHITQKLPAVQIL